MYVCKQLELTPAKTTAGSLASLVYQHSITPLALPCKLVLPEHGESQSGMSTIRRTDTLSKGTSAV